MTRAIKLCLLVLVCASCAHRPPPEELLRDPATVSFPSTEPNLFSTKLMLTGRLQKPMASVHFLLWYCSTGAVEYNPSATINAPLLILIGEKDDWTPAERCVSMIPSGKSNFEVVLQVYPDAYHAYDSISKPREVMGARGSHHLEHNPIAEQDSIIRVKDFLEKYLQR